MVTTGLSNGKKTDSTELIIFDRKHCKHEHKIDSYPLQLESATGSLVNDSIIICGGMNFAKLVFVDVSNECYLLGPNTNFTFTFLTNMTKQRYLASSTVIGSQLWITGGCMNTDQSFNDACLQVNPSLA